MRALSIYTITAVTIAALALPHSTGPIYPSHSNVALERRTSGENGNSLPKDRCPVHEGKGVRTTKIKCHNELHGKVWWTMPTKMNPTPGCFASTGFTQVSKAAVAHVLCFEFELPDGAQLDPEEFGALRYFWLRRGVRENGILLPDSECPIASGKGVRTTKHGCLQMYGGEAWCDLPTAGNPDPKPPCFKPVHFADVQSEAAWAQVLCFKYKEVPSSAEILEGNGHKGLKYLWIILRP